LALADEHDSLLINLCGRGDKDMQSAAELFELGPN
jgi:tryptophan synthase beta chain